ncbi:hypothetical protein SDC9_189914 [bioreactor metagenome]|uniref:Uncharacterized protein n=1 Tax=bioreactor metagenome TaxID=1076179 RepID=A0A645HTR2_9ZZZZ
MQDQNLSLLVIINTTMINLIMLNFMTITLNLVKDILIMKYVKVNMNGY